MRILKLADYHFAICEEMGNQLKSYIDCKQKNIGIIYNGIEIKENIKINLSSQTRFLYIGRLEYGYGKQVDFLLHALSRLKGKWSIDIIGEGRDKQKLIELSNELGICNQIYWHGWREDPWSQLNESSALVLTSKYEGFGLVLIEAMIRGLPCISSDCPTGPKEIISHGINGYLYEEGNLEDLVFYMQKFVVNPIQFNQEVVITSVKKFDIDIVADNMIKQMQNIISKR